LVLIEAQTVDTVLNELVALHGDATAKRTAARVAALGLFGAGALPDVGGEVWRTLWDAARRYSIEIAHLEVFPPADPGALCVLCQQPLSAEALQRMQRFEAFIQDDTEKQAQEQRGNSTAPPRTRRVIIRYQPIADSLREVRLHDEALAGTIRRALASARRRRYFVQRRIAGNGETEIPPPNPSERGNHEAAGGYPQIR